MALSETLLPVHGLLLIGSFILGAVIGFCNVCISRWPQENRWYSPFAVENA